MMLESFRHNEAGSVELAAASKAHCEKFTVCSEICVSNFITGDCKTEGKAGV